MLKELTAWSDEEREQITAVIRTLMRQTFLLEKKYDKKTGRFLFNKEYRTGSLYLEFLQDYFQAAGITLTENSQMGILYLTGEDVMAERLGRLCTIYLLVLKLIYDEQMAQASTSVHVHTTLGELNARVGSFSLLKERPSATEIRRTLTLLKKYQILEVLDPLEELGSDLRLMIYPTISMVLLGEQVAALLSSFEEAEEEKTHGNGNEA